jgi:hypothetical protein
MQLKKQVNNKIRENIKKTQNGYKYQISIHCVKLDKETFSLLDCLVMPSVARHLSILGRGKRPLPN